MNKKTLLNAALLAVSLAFPPLALAAASAPVAAQPGMAAGEHAGHAEHADAAGAAGASGATRPRAWTAFPMLKTKVSGESRARRMVVVVPQDIAVNSVDIYSNNAGDAKAHRQLPLDMAGAKLDKPESGGFHWLAAREEQGDRVRVASAVHFFGERGAQNPTAMFMQQKHELEIIPQPYPREHSRYRANEDWKFLVRFNGKPLADQWVRLETQNGTRFDFASDAQGVVTVGIPDDFKKAVQEKTAGAHNPRRLNADFVLATEHTEGGKTYLTAFNASYGADAFYQRDLVMGLGFTLLGMIGAAPLLRQRKDKKQADESAKSKEA